MKPTNYPGIDYGLGQTNIDKASGIRNGVLPFHDIGQSWHDASEANYGNPDAFCELECGDCGKEFSLNEAQGNRPIAWGDSVTCPHCGEQTEVNIPDMAEPVSFYYEADGYACEQGADDCDIFICKSPFYTHAQFCSPCAPGACYLRSPLEQPDENNRAFCFGHDWFESGVAPYPVYSVATGLPVNPQS